MDRELRYSQPLYEIRAKDGESGFTGYAATFNRVDSYGTAFAPSAFDKTLAERRDKLRVLYNHNPDINFGILNDIRTDERGLYVDVHVVDDGADGTVFMRRLRSGIQFGLSFGFRTIQQRAATESDQLDMAQILDATLWDGVRINTEVKLFEVSPVTFPSNEIADITGVRQQARADALTSLLDDIAENRLSEDERALMARIAAAFPQAPGSQAAPREERSARRWDAELALARMRFGQA